MNHIKFNQRLRKVRFKYQILQNGDKQDKRYILFPPWSESIQTYNKQKDKLTSLRSKVWPYTTSRDNNFHSFVSQICTILRKLDSFNGVSEPDHLMFLDSFPSVIVHSTVWHHVTITEPHHLMLLDSFTWRYWTVSPDVTGQFHLALLDSFTWHYWA